MNALPPLSQFPSSAIVPAPCHARECDHIHIGEAEYGAQDGGKLNVNQLYMAVQAVESRRRLRISLVFQLCWLRGSITSHTPLSFGAARIYCSPPPNSVAFHVYIAVRKAMKGQLCTKVLPPLAECILDYVGPSDEIQEAMRSEFEEYVQSRANHRMMCFTQSFCGMANRRRFGFWHDGERSAQSRNQVACLKRKRLWSASNHPEEHNARGDLGANQQEQSVEMAVDEGAGALAADEHGSTDQRKAKKSRQ